MRKWATGFEKGTLLNSFYFRSIPQRVLVVLLPGTGFVPPAISNMLENALLPLYAWPLEPVNKIDIIIDAEFGKLTHSQVTHIRENIKENFKKCVKKCIFFFDYHYSNLPNHDYATTGRRSFAFVVGLCH